MKCNRVACSVTGPGSRLFSDFHHFLQVCIDDLDQLSEQENSAPANPALHDSTVGGEYER